MENNVNNTKKNKVIKILKEHIFRDEKTIIGTAIIIFVFISGALMLKEEFGKIIAENFGTVDIVKKYEKYKDRDYTDKMADEGEGMYALVKESLAHGNPKYAFQTLREFWWRRGINNPENEDPEGWKLLQDIIKLAEQQGDEEALLPY